MSTAKHWRSMLLKALINNIKVIDRIRKNMNKIDELAADIKSNGLINPITVMSLNNSEFRLLAGLRRLRAVESLGLAEIDINIVAPADAEAELRIEISENELREAFTFSEKMDFARLLEEIEAAKAQKRKLAGKRADLVDDRPQGHERSRDVVGSKIGMSGRQYSRAKHIAENAPDEVIEELDNGVRTINRTYDELRSKEKVDKIKVDAAPEDAPAVPKYKESTHKPSDKKKDVDDATALAIFSKADQEAILRNREFNAMPPEEQVVELKRQLKEERVRAIHAESELSRFKELRHNEVYHKDGIIENLKKQLANAFERIKELEEKYCPDAVEG